MLRVYILQAWKNQTNKVGRKFVQQKAFLRDSTEILGLVLRTFTLTRVINFQKALGQTSVSHLKE